jgi:hypothetical protein
MRSWLLWKNETIVDAGFIWRSTSRGAMEQGSAATPALGGRQCSPPLLKWNWAPERMPDGQRAVTAFCLV